MAIINFNFPYVPDPDKGKPLAFCKLFVGIPDLDPEIIGNQKQLNVVQEDGTLIPVTQPLTFSAGGVPTYNGSTVRLDVDGNYSFKILDSGSNQKYYVHNVFEGEPITVDSLINDPAQTHNFATVAAYKAFTTAFPVDKRIYLADRDAYFTVIAGTGTDNMFNIIASDQVSQSIALVEELPKSTVTEAEAISDLNAYEGKRFLISDRGLAEFELQTGQTADTFSIIDVDAPLLSLVYIPKNNTYYTSAFGVKASTTGGTDYTAAFQASIDALPNGCTWVNDVDTTICKTTEISITSKSNCLFTGEGLIQLADGNTVLNSKAMLNPDSCQNCDFVLRFDGNNQNNSNDTNGTTGLIGCITLTSSTDCNLRNSRAKNCNNVAFNISVDCVNCHIHHNYSKDSFGTDFKLGNGCRDCTIHGNTGIVTRNIHAEDYSGTGTDGKQDGFVAARFGVVNGKIYNNTGDNTNGTGTDLGVLGFAAWYTGLAGTFESYGNTWTGGDDSIQCYLDDTVDLELLRLEDTCLSVQSGSGGVTVGTVGAKVAHVESLIMRCPLVSYSTGVSIESNGGNFTIGSANVKLSGVIEEGANALVTTVDNVNVTGSIKHKGTSNAIIFTSVNKGSVVGTTIKMDSIAGPEGVKLDNSSGCRVVANEISMNNGNSVEETGTADNNIVTNNICNTNIVTIGAATINANNLQNVT